MIFFKDIFWFIFPPHISPGTHVNSGGHGYNLGPWYKQLLIFGKVAVFRRAAQNHERVETNRHKNKHLVRT